MQILLRLVSRDRFNIVDGQRLYYGLKGADVLDRVQWIVQTPTDYWKHNGLDPDQRAKIDAILHEPNKATISADQTMPRRKRSLAICTWPSAFEKAVKKHDTCSDGNDKTDNTNVSDNATNDADIVLGKM